MDSRFQQKLATLVLVALSAASTNGQVTVQTPLGTVRGVQFTDPASKEPIYQFRGIRYGKPPIGENRFKKPEPAGAWGEEYDATSSGTSCPQMSIPSLRSTANNQSEDCLFLNVYVPRTVSPERKLTVMVWIHGGGFWFGSGNDYDGTRLAMDGNVIVVTMNYRLGILGFLSVDHAAARGNYAIWDQKLAFQWVHDNIGAFGGDRNSVTIFGESAGGWSVSCHSLIPSNAGLFQRVIAQSGVVSRIGFLRRKTIKKFIKIISERTACSADNLNSFVDCLRNIPAHDVIKSSMYVPDDKFVVEHMERLSIDGELFSVHPLVQLEDPNSEQSKFFRSLDFMTGTVTSEGSLLHMRLSQSVQQHFGFNVKDGIPSEFVCDGFIQPYVELNYDNDQRVADALCSFYSSNEDLAKQSRLATDLYGDIVFFPPSVDMLNLHVTPSAKTYQYQFTRISPLPFGPKAPSWFRGTGHADELLYLFHSDPEGEGHHGIMVADLNDEDAAVSKTIIQYWTTFAQNG